MDQFPSSHFMTKINITWRQWSCKNWRISKLIRYCALLGLYEAIKARQIMPHWSLKRIIAQLQIAGYKRWQQLSSKCKQGDKGTQFTWPSGDCFEVSIQMCLSSEEFVLSNCHAVLYRLTPSCRYRQTSNDRHGRPDFRLRFQVPDADWTDWLRSSFSSRGRIGDPVISWYRLPSFLPSVRSSIRRRQYV